MDSSTQTKQKLAFRLLSLAALVLLAAVYFSPIWWVSLKAPNYPPEAFPDGVRIHFHMDGVFSGCKFVEKAELTEHEALDCVHEMDAINHFVGMYPIASGGVVEKGFSPFLVSLLAVMLIGFMITNAKARMAVMAAGFAGIAGWMSVTLFTADGLRYHSSSYLESMVTSLGQGEEEEGGELSPIIAQLERSLRESGQTSMVSREELTQRLESTALGEAIGRLHEGTKAAQPKSLKQILEENKQKARTLSPKEASLGILKAAFEADQLRSPASEREAWTGSGWQVLYWHYEKALGRWFNVQEEIKPLVATMRTAGKVVFGAVLAAMIFLVFAARTTKSPLFWILALGPVALPVAFIVEYSAWLWWYGHTLNEMGAFTLKPFMPTVFGQGKVAQFSTHSYPHVGFGFMMGVAICTLLAALIRRKFVKETGSE